MKVLVRGNQVMIQTDINKEDYDKYKGYDVFKVNDENNDMLYALSFNEDVDARISNWGITCDTVYQGKLSASVLVVGDMDAFLEDYKPAFLALKENELTIATQINEIKARLAGLDDLIEIED